MSILLLKIGSSMPNSRPLCGSITRERMTHDIIAHHLGRKVLEDVANVVKPDTLLGWYRSLITRKFDESKGQHWLCSF
jgi:hypothetical protein